MLTWNFCYCCSTWAVQSEEYCNWIYPSAGSGSSESLFVFSAVYTGEWSRGKGSGNTKTVDVWTLLEAFLNLFPRSSCFTDEVLFYSKKQNFQCQDYSPQVPDNQDFWTIRWWIERISLYMHIHTYTCGSNSSVEDINPSGIMQ